MRPILLATPEEFRVFGNIMVSVRNLRPVSIGAQLLHRLGGVAAEAMYKLLWQWVDGRTAFFLNITGKPSPPRCAYYNPDIGAVVSDECVQGREADIVCEFSKPTPRSVNQTVVKLVSSVTADLDDTVWNVSMVQCPSGHVTRDFLSCDIQRQCGAKESMLSLIHI